MAKLTAIINEYKGDLQRLHRDSCLELGNRVKESTPVDTGRAKGSWSDNGAPVIGRSYRYSSNLEYIVPLEYGHSQQAPSGMLRINVRNWRSIVENQIKRRS